MGPLSTMRRAVVIGAVTILLLAARPAVGHASSAVDAYLAKYPGGQAISDNEISYDNGRFIVTLTRPPNTQAAPDCPSDWFCFYERIGYGYPRGKLSDCGWQSLITYGWQDRVESVYYRFSRGKVEFRDYGTPIFSVGAGSPADSDVYPYRNRATEVYRYC